jgi:thioredoxin:protein disulfide reductase
MVFSSLLYAVLCNVLLLAHSSLMPSVTITKELLDKKRQKIHLSFNVQAHEYVYKDSISLSIDSPDILLGPWQSNKKPLTRYDEASKETKSVFDESFVLSFIAENIRNQSIDDAAVHISYHYNTQQAPETSIFPLSFIVPQANPPQKIATTYEQNVTTTKQAPKPASTSLTSSLWNYSTYVSTLIEQSKSTPIRLLLVFLLGVLLSLTPCIYPMIPITIGILQAQRSSSFLHNFLLALFYTGGLATTFACLGLLASFSGPMYGTLLVHPVSVVCIVLILLYLAFSMFGFYEIYIPRFMQATSIKTNGSLFSAFLFGAASGTIASPCVSPGLALLLSIVATLGSTMLGFLLLFAFGVGLSTPLLIVGTFSNSLALLPKTGAWMMEIKKLFGLMLIGACVYYLKNILPLSSVFFFCAALSLGIGSYYLYTNFYTSVTSWKKFNTLFGMLLIASSVPFLAQGIKMLHAKQAYEKAHAWKNSYEEARNEALQKNKLLFIDFWAQFCSLCSAINSTVLTEKKVMAALEAIAVPVMIDGTNAQKDPYKTLQQNYDVQGFPTFLLIDPVENRIIKKWGGELYHMPLEEFIHALHALQNPQSAKAKTLQ